MQIVLTVKPRPIDIALRLDRIRMRFLDPHKTSFQGWFVHYWLWRFELCSREEETICWHERDPTISIRTTGHQF
jgi:hypothetical protein